MSTNPIGTNLMITTSKIKIINKNLAGFSLKVCRLVNLIKIGSYKNILISKK